MFSTASVLAQVSAFDPGADGEAAKSRELVLSLLAESGEPFSRLQFNPGHITCSGLVLSPTRAAILLVLHRRLGRWLLPGGHVEAADDSPAAAARREVMEETGARIPSGIAPRLVGIDVHGIPPRRDEPFHLHHDLSFLFHAESERFTVSEEVREVVWCAVEEFDRYQLPVNLRRAYARAIA